MDHQETLRGEPDLKQAIEGDIKVADPLARFRTFSRRDFLKLSVTGLGALAARMLPQWKEPVSNDKEPFFQMDLPSGLGLVQIKPRDTLWDLAGVLGVNQEYLATLNGIDDPKRQVLAGDFLLVPSGVSGIKYASEATSVLHTKAVVRVVQDPENVSKNADYSERELLLLNKAFRGIDRLATGLLGPLSMATGFYRVIRAAGVDLMTSEDSRLENVYSGSRLFLRTNPRNSLEQYLSWESKRRGYSEEKFLSDYAKDFLYGLAHIKMAKLNSVGPFNINNIAISASSMAERLFPDTGYEIGGYRVGVPFYYNDFKEWYLMRENEAVFSSLVTRIILSEKLNKQLSKEDVMAMVFEVFPRYGEWENEYNTPLSAIKPLQTGKNFVWNSSDRSYVGGEKTVSWWRRIESVHYPKKEERVPSKYGIDRFIADPNFTPTRGASEFLEVRSWEFVGFSEYGTQPPEGADEATFPIVNSDKNMISYLSDGTKLISPTKPKSVPAGSWV